MNAVESITASRLVSLARLNLAEATAWALHAESRGVLPVRVAGEIDSLLFLLGLLDDAVAEGTEVSDGEALTVLQRACVLYGEVLGLLGRSV